MNKSDKPASSTSSAKTTAVTEPKATTLAQLPSLGKQSEKMLHQAGITTIEQLQQLGAVAAYVRTKQTTPNVSLNLLWALESALTGIPWQTVSRQHRTSLLLALEDAEAAIKATP